MVDCDYFTDFNRDLTIENNRIILQFKKCNYNLELSFPYTGCKKIEKSSNNLNFKKKVQIKAVYGIIEMEVNNYLIAVTKANLIGQIFGRKVFQVQKMDYFCLAAQESSKDRKYIQGLEQLFSTKSWYFSDEYDLTSSLQQFVANGYSLKNKRLEYMYNADWIDDFLKLKAYEWITGFTTGFINISFAHIGSSTYDIALITRRDRRRQGKRWVTRGADLDGNTVNTAQTEMVIQTQLNGKKHIFSHVQLRGSMPFIWKQSPDLKWSPKVTIGQNDRLNCHVMRKNYEDILKSYQNCTIVNLIDKKGSQKRLGQYFDRTHRSVDIGTIILLWFDFHAECKNMQYENLSRLLDQMTHQLQNYGYFHIEMGKEKEGTQRPQRKNIQKGIFRTNCMDCLDRTNVVQSVIARYLLLSWMNKVGLIGKSRTNSAFQRLPDSIQDIFRNQWTANANAISLLYSGTPAQKTDFTQTGKRTRKGAMNDGYYSIKRYFLGNFYDSRSQDYIDFSLGKLKPKKNTNEQIKHSGVNAVWIFLALIILACLATSQLIDNLLPNESLTIHYKFIGSLVTTGLVLFLAQKGKSLFVRKPTRQEQFC